MHVIHWKKESINDLIKIGQHIAKDSPASAGKIIDLIEGKVTPLGAHPTTATPAARAAPTGWWGAKAMS